MEVVYRTEGSTLACQAAIEVLPAAFVFGLRARAQPDIGKR